MPIRPELRHLYPTNWPEISRHVRFKRSKGRCQACKRPHLARVKCMPDGRWFDEKAGNWRNARGQLLARWPNLLEAAKTRHTKVVLAAAHFDGDASNSGKRNLRCWCQRCHILHDRRQHQLQRWITFRRRYARADLFLGAYEELLTAVAIDAALTA